MSSLDRSRTLRAVRRAILSLLVVLAGLAITSSAGAHPPTVSAANSTAYWNFAGDNNVVDAGARHGQDCAEQEYHRYTWDCITEYDYRRPDGSRGNRWFLVFGDVSWTGVYPNPYGRGYFGTPQSQTYKPLSWIRYWHRDTAGCLRSWQVSGYVVSNMPCGSVADAINHGDARIGYISGTGTGYWPWLYSFPCSRKGDWTNCQNKVGDVYRYKGSFTRRGPTVHV